MKVLCVDCGCHFKDEFKQSLKCSFWERRGLGKIPKKYKKMIWDWIFSAPADVLGIKAHIALSLSFHGMPYEGNQWEKTVEGYKDWSDEEKKAFQKLYFLEILGRPTTLLPQEDSFARGKKKK